MIRVTLVCVGRIKEDYLKEAVREYSKRLSGYCRLQIVEVADEKTPDGASEAEEMRILQVEGDRILQKIPQGATVITLEIEGKKMDSVGFARWIETKSVQGMSHLVLVIGGSLGLSRQVKDRADLALSFSDMTFPHQLMRVILLEQLYRACRINAKEPYHK